jgi:AcrR family transcriptional regulator
MSRSLTKDRILTAAIALLDQEGLAAFNLRALGRALGSAPTAIYWYMGSKEQLVRLAADQLWCEIAPPVGGADWRAAARWNATELYRLLLRHPWVVQSLGSVVIYGPAKARYDEACLGVFEGAGFSDGDTDQAATAVVTFVLGAALGPAAVAAQARHMERGEASAQHGLAAQLAEARQIAAAFPRLNRRLGTPAAAYARGPEQSFEFGLEALLDGIGHRLKRPGRN